MKVIKLLLIFYIMPALSLSPSTVLLPEVLNPDSLFITQDRIYITEGATIYIYKKDNAEFVGKFGKKGEGPGEFNTSGRGGTALTLGAVSDNLFIQNRSKVLFFNKDGRFIQESKLNNGFIRGMLPVGKNFVARSFKMGENRTRTESVDIYNKDFKKVGEIPQKKESAFSRGSFFKIYFEENIFNMKADNGIIYINNTKDFLIHTFNESGREIHHIKVDYDQKKVSAAQKAKIRNFYKNDPRFSGFWERMKDMLEIADTYPAIKSFYVDNEKIYVQTFNRNSKGYEFFILDAKGKLVNKKTVPIPSKNLMEDFPFFIKDKKVYILSENEDEEEWELSTLQI